MLLRCTDPWTLNLQWNFGLNVFLVLTRLVWWAVLVSQSACWMTGWLMFDDWTSIRLCSDKPLAHKVTYPVDTGDYTSSRKAEGNVKLTSYHQGMKFCFYPTPTPLYPVSWRSDEGATPEDCPSSNRTLHTTICSWQKPRVFKQLLLLCHQITSDLPHRQAVLFMFHMQYCSYMMESMPRPRQDSFLSLHLLSQLFCHQCSVFIPVFSFMLIY